MLPVALAEAAEAALARLAIESVPVVISLIEKLAEPAVPHDVIVALEKIVDEIRKHPDKTTAERAALALVTSLAADRAAEALLR